MRNFVKLEPGDRHSWDSQGYVWVVRKAYFVPEFNPRAIVSMYKSKKPNVKIGADGMLETDGTEYSILLKEFDWQEYKPPKKASPADGDSEADS